MTVTKTAATLLAGIALAACEESGIATPADLVLTNAYVYTVDAQRSIADAVAIEDGSIVYVGTTEGASSFIDSDTEVRDMGGQMLLPGLHDMHIHTLGTVEADSCDLGSARYTLEQLVPVLQQCIEDYAPAPGEWLVALQWSFSSGNEPNADLPHIRAALDKVSTQHPVFLYGDDGHHGAANSLALSMAQDETGERLPINAQTLQTAYVDYKPLIEVDLDGVPNGGIHEGARGLLRPNWFQDMLGMSGDLDGKMQLAAAKMAENGITSLQDAIVTPDTLAAYGRLEKSGAMTFRVRAAMVEPASENLADIDTHLTNLAALRDQYKNYRFVDANAVKLFADAVLEGNPLSFPPALPVAAILGEFKQPIFGGSIDDGSFEIVGYVDQNGDACRAVQSDTAAYMTRERLDGFVSEFGYYPQQCIPSSGVLEHDEEFIRRYIRAATEAGFNVHVHALSDKGVRVAVDEFAKVKKTADRLGVSQSLAHMQLIHPDDQRRIGELGIAAVFTFIWTQPDLQYEMMVIPFIDQIAGIEDLYNPDTYYMQNAYPARSLQKYGALLVNGSDAPVGSRDPMPFASLQQAVYRSNGDAVLNPEQRIDIHSAIEAFTINGARLFGHDERVGSIEVGKAADIIAIDQNLIELATAGDIQSIDKTRVTLTLFDGKVVFQAGEESATGPAANSQ